MPTRQGRCKQDRELSYSWGWIGLTADRQSLIPSTEIDADARWNDA